MSKKADDWKLALAILLGGLGAAAIAIAATDQKKKEQRYSCHSCGTLVAWGTPRCPTCGVSFVWQPVEEINGPLSALVKTLKPHGLWFGSVTAMLGLVVWCYHGDKFADWPFVFQCLAWIWLAAAFLAIPYIHVTEFGTWAAQKLAEKAASREIPKTKPAPLPGPVPHSEATTRAAEVRSGTGS